MKAWLLLWIGMLGSAFGAILGWIISNPDGRFVEHGFVALVFCAINFVVVNVCFILEYKNDTNN